MRPRAVKAIGFFEERNDLFETFEALFAGYEVSMNSSEDGHYTETAAACGDDALIMSGINVVHMDTFSAHSAVGFGSRPEILKGLSFHQVEQCGVGKRTGLVLGLNGSGVDETVKTRMSVSLRVMQNRVSNYRFGL